MDLASSIIGGVSGGLGIFLGYFLLEWYQKHFFIPNNSQRLLTFWEKYIQDKSDTVNLSAMGIKINGKQDFYDLSISDINEAMAYLSGDDNRVGCQEVNGGMINISGHLKNHEVAI